VRFSYAGEDNTKSRKKKITRLARAEQGLLLFWRDSSAGHCRVAPL